MAASSLSIGTWGWSGGGSLSIGTWGWVAPAAVTSNPAGGGRSAGMGRGRISGLPAAGGRFVEDDDDESLLLMLLFPFMDM